MASTPAPTQLGTGQPFTNLWVIIVNEHSTSNSPTSARTVTPLVKSALAFTAFFLIGAVVGCWIILTVNSIGYRLITFGGFRLDNKSSTIKIAIDFVMILVTFATALVLLSLHLRRTNRDSIINIRSGFLSGVTLVSAMFAIYMLFVLQVYVTGFGEGRVVSPISLDVAKRARAAVEQDTRGYFFAQIALHLASESRSGKRFSEAQVIEHLGPPDLVKVEKEVKRFAYYYAQVGSKDSVVYVDFNLNDPYADFGFNSASVVDHSDWDIYEAK